jgi:hypothetical protein
MIVLFFPLVTVSQSIIKTLFLANGSNMAPSNSMISRPVLIPEALAFSLPEKQGMDLKTLATSEYPGGYCENPYRVFNNVNL